MAQNLSTNKISFEDFIFQFALLLQNTFECWTDPLKAINTENPTNLNKGLYKSCYHPILFRQAAVAFF